jgi:hypothetical protein
MKEVEEKLKEDKQTFEETSAVEKTKIMSRFKKEFHPVPYEIRKYFTNRYTYINDIYTEIQDDINHTFKKDAHKFVHIFHSQPVFHREYAIKELCRLLNISKTFYPNTIPPDHFDQTFLVKKANNHYLVYFDTRSLARRTDEPEKSGYKISDDCEKIAKLCSGAFGLTSKSIKSVQGAMSIFTKVLNLWSQAKVVNGIYVDKQINNVRIHYIPYLIVTRKKDVIIACQLKSYKELEADKDIFSIPVVRELAEWMAKVLNISAKPKIDEIYSTIIDSDYKNAFKLYNIELSEEVEKWATANNIDKYTRMSKTNDESSVLSEKQLESIKLQLKNVTPYKVYERVDFGAITIFEQNRKTSDRISEKKSFAENSVSTVKLSSTEPAINQTSPPILYDIPSGTIIRPNIEVSSLQNLHEYNILELLVEFGLKYSKSIIPLTPRDLTNSIRHLGYKKSFYLYKINTRNVASDIDKYLRQFNTSWKAININGNTRFHNNLTKYDK